MHVLARYSVGVQCVFPGSECRVDVVLLHCVCDGRASCYRTIRYIEPIKGIFEHMYENIFKYGILVLTFAGCFKDKRFETTPISSPSKA